MKLLHHGEFVEMETLHLKRKIIDPQFNVRSESDTLKMCRINHHMTHSLEVVMDALEFCDEKDIGMIT